MKVPDAVFSTAGVPLRLNLATRVRACAHTHTRKGVIILFAIRFSLVISLWLTIFSCPHRPFACLLL